jgi:glycosyltransferase involved in cell wall biosynthesis
MRAVSVVIPAYNHGRYLGEAIESALSSVGVQPSVIVIDDGSTDNTSIIAQAFPMITYVRQANAGAHNAINAGFAIASTEFVAILNDDDLYLKSHLRDSLRRLEGLDADLCLGEPTLIGTGPLRDGMETHLRESDRLIRRYGRALTLLSWNWFVSTSAMVMSKQTWSMLGGFHDLRFCHDLDFALRALTGHRVVTYLDEPSWVYRCHGSNTASSIQDDARESELRQVLAGVRIGMGVELPKDLMSIGYGPLFGVTEESSA